MVNLVQIESERVDAKETKRVSYTHTQHQCRRGLINWHLSADRCRPIKSILVSFRCLNSHKCMCVSVHICEQRLYTHTNSLSFFILFFIFIAFSVSLLLFLSSYKTLLEGRWQLDALSATYVPLYFT